MYIEMDLELNDRLDTVKTNSKNITVQKQNVSSTTTSDGY